MGHGADTRKAIKKREEEEASSSSRNVKKPRTTYGGLAYAGTERVAPTTPQASYQTYPAV